MAMAVVSNYRALGRSLLLATALGLLAGGCVGVIPEEDDVAQQGLIDGTTTEERNEIGDMGGCTATLIRPNVVISAAHCLSYSTRQNPGRYATFSIDTPEGWRRYTARRVHSFSNTLGARDVLLLQLSESVPPDVATPTRVSDVEPDQGDEVTIFGYGCTSRRNRSGSGTKRKVGLSYGDFSNHLCPGDSGGPLVRGLNGPVFGINSGYYTNSGEDIFGKPYEIKIELEAKIRQWEELDGAPVARREIEVTNTSSRQVFVRCAKEDSATCSWWTVVEPGQTTWLAAPDNTLMIDDDDFGGGWNWHEATAPGGDSVTIYDNPNHPFYPVGQEPEVTPDVADPGGDQDDLDLDPEPEPAPEAEPDPQPEAQPQPDPEPEPQPEPQPDPQPEAEPDFVDEPREDPAPQGDEDEGQRPLDPGPNPDSDGQWVDQGGGNTNAWSDERTFEVGQGPLNYDREAVCTVTSAGGHGKEGSPLLPVLALVTLLTPMIRRR